MINRYKFAISHGFVVTLNFFIFLYSLWFMLSSGLKAVMLSPDIVLTPFVAFVLIGVISILSQILSKTPAHWSVNACFAITFIMGMVVIIFSYKNLKHFSTFILPLFSFVYLLLNYFFTYRRGIKELQEGFVKESDFQLFYGLSAFFGFLLVDAVVLTHTGFEIVAKTNIDIIVFFVIYSLIIIVLEVLVLYSVDSLRKVIRRFKNDLNVAAFDLGMKEIASNNLNPETLNFVYIRWAYLLIDIDVIEAIELYHKTYEPHVRKYRRFYPLLKASIALYSGEFETALTIMENWTPHTKFLKYSKTRTTYFIQILQNKEDLEIVIPQNFKGKSELDSIKNAVFISIYYYNKKRFSDAKKLEDYANARIQRLPTLYVILQNRNSPLSYEQNNAAKRINAGTN